MFADLQIDTKQFHEILSSEDALTMQDDLDKLTDWSSKWLLKFNLDKCRIMHCGQSNPCAEYVMNECSNEPRVLKSTSLEADLGVMVTNNLKATSHCEAASKKAARALRLLKMAFSSLSLGNFKMLSTTYVQPHLDYCLQAVSSYMVQDIQRLEKV